MNEAGVTKLDDFLLDCAEISQDDRGFIMDFVAKLEED